MDLVYLKVIKAKDIFSYQITTDFLPYFRYYTENLDRYATVAEFDLFEQGKYFSLISYIVL